MSEKVSAADGAPLVDAGTHVAKPTSSNKSDMFWFIVCAVGVTGSFSVYGVCLEHATSKSSGAKMDEASFVFITSAAGTVIALIAKLLCDEKPVSISPFKFLFLSLTSILSTFTSVLSLRYVIYPVQVVAKSCKPVPVMIFGTILGKRYTLIKYLNVLGSSIGLLLFMSRGEKGGIESIEESTVLLYYGATMLLSSLCFDGLTGAYEDKLMAREAVGPFTLMFAMQVGKTFLSLMVIIGTRKLPNLIAALSGANLALPLLGFTGAVGQIFIYLTINKFGALNCSLIGLGRKLLSLVLSFILYKHELSIVQTAGLMLSVAAMVSNLFERGERKESSHGDVAVALPIAAADPEAQYTTESSSLLHENSATEGARATEAKVIYF